MDPVRVFVAASSEGDAIAGLLVRLLRQELRDGAEVELWRHAFDYSDTAIESLERVAEVADFAVLLLTPDDVTRSRQQQSAAPRDNLVFELGLFIGALGRKRTIVARDLATRLKLPSDILGVTSLPFDASSPAALERSLRQECGRLAGQIARQGLRPKWLALGRAALAANAEFCRGLAGPWWERIAFEEGSALSFFTIAPEPMAGSVLLEGAGFGKDGEATALWRSEMVRLYPAERRCAYLWRGRHPLPGSAHLQFHGYGTMEFEPPEEPAGLLSRGGGYFWDVDEARPDKTVPKSIALRRVTDPAQVAAMTTGAQAGRSQLVRSVLESW